MVITHLPSNTDGNSVVLFRKSDVVSAGDLLDLTAYPVIDVAAGGSIQAIVTGLNRLIDITVPASHAGGGTLVIPGHGRIADHAEVVYYRDMMTIIRDRVQDMVKKGMTLAAGEGGQTLPRLRHALRQADRSLDDGYVRRGCVSEPQEIVDSRV